MAEQRSKETQEEFNRSVNARREAEMARAKAEAEARMAANARARAEEARVAAEARAKEAIRASEEAERKRAEAEASALEAEARLQEALTRWREETEAHHERVEGQAHADALAEAEAPVARFQRGEATDFRARPEQPLRPGGFSEIQRRLLKLVR